MTQRVLEGLSLLLIGDDALARFRLQRRLAAAGARVASGDLEQTRPFLQAHALGAIVVAADLNPRDSAALAAAPVVQAHVPWCVVGGEVQDVLRGRRPTLVAGGEPAELTAVLQLSPPPTAPDATAVSAGTHAL